MKATLLMALLFCIGATHAQNIVKLKNETDSVSYSVGLDIAKNLKQSGLDKLNNPLILRAIQDYLKKSEKPLEQSQTNSIISNFLRKKQESKYGKHQKEHDSFFANNKKQKGIITTASGLQYQILTKGEGPTPLDNEKVKVNYTLSFPTGEVLESTFLSNKPITFATKGVIKGWQEALKMMKKGSKWKIFVPYTLGYGKAGRGKIPPCAILIFTIELLEIVK